MIRCWKLLRDMVARDGDRQNGSIQDTALQPPVALLWLMPVGWLTQISPWYRVTKWNLYFKNV